MFLNYAGRRGARGWAASAATLQRGPRRGHPRAFGFFFGDEISKSDPLYFQKTLFQVYHKRVVPLERKYSFAKFTTPELREADFLAAPMVLLLGQYSTGKTSMIEYLIDSSIPGRHIGPEPTTDKFVAVMHGEGESADTIVPGHAAVSQSDLAFKSLETYGSSFLPKFEVARVDSEILRQLTIIDSPGVLSGEKQSRGSRGYDYASVTQHFAERADRIILLFDCSKLDISDEFEEVVRSLHGNQDKVRCLLNKADQVDAQELFRVYGALLWSLGKVVQTPEVLRVFVGSMWGQPYAAHADAESNHKLFDLEREAILGDLRNLPKQSRVRRINETVKRWRAVRTHAMLCSHLAEQFGWIGKADAQTNLLLGLEHTYGSLARRHGLNAADFPDADNFRRVVQDQDIKMWEWSPTDAEELEKLDHKVNAAVHDLL